MIFFGRNRNLEEYFEQYAVSVGLGSVLLTALQSVKAKDTVVSPLSSAKRMRDTVCENTASDDDDEFKILVPKCTDRKKVSAPTAAPLWGGLRKEEEHNSKTYIPGTAADFIPKCKLTNSRGRRSERRRAEKIARARS